MYGGPRDGSRSSLGTIFDTTAVREAAGMARGASSSLKARRGSLSRGFESVGAKHVIFNIFVLVCGVTIGLSLRDGRTRTCGAKDQMAQYSMVPCKFRPWNLPP